MFWVLYGIKDVKMSTFWRDFLHIFPKHWKLFPLGDIVVYLEDRAVNIYCYENLESHTPNLTQRIKH